MFSFCLNSTSVSKREIYNWWTDDEWAVNQWNWREPFTTTFGYSKEILCRSPHGPLLHPGRVIFLVPVWWGMMNGPISHRANRWPTGTDRDRPGTVFFLCRQTASRTTIIHLQSVGEEKGKIDVGHCFVRRPRDRTLQVNGVDSSFYSNKSPPVSHSQFGCLITEAARLNRKKQKQKMGRMRKIQK